jgi:hypothetical protein
MNAQERLTAAMDRISEGRDAETMEPLDRELAGWLKGVLRRAGAEAAEDFATYLEAA